MSRRFEWWLSLFLIIGGVGLLGGAAFLYFVQQSPPGPTLEVETDVVVDGVAGTKQRLAIPLHNRTRKPMRVLGVVEC